MVVFIDRTNKQVQPTGNSIPNIERYKRKERPTPAEILEAAKGRRLSASEDVVLRAHEPQFRRDLTKGVKEMVYPGNFENAWRQIFTANKKRIRGRTRYIPGDVIRKEAENEWWRHGGVDVAGQTKFRQRVSDEVFVDMYLEALGVPTYFKHVLSGRRLPDQSNSYLAPTRNTSNMRIGKSYEKGMRRKIAQGNWSAYRIQEETKKLEKMKQNGTAVEEIEALAELIERKKVKGSGHTLDPDLDLVGRHNIIIPPPKPRALMFAILDVGYKTMDAYKVDLAHSTLKLLQLYLRNKYDSMDMAFIVHSDRAEIVDENTFFKRPWLPGFSEDKEISSGLLSVQTLLTAYPTEHWNIYGVQISDGQSDKDDIQRCLEILGEGSEALLSRMEYFAYAEVRNDKSEELLDKHMKGIDPNYKEVHNRDSPLWTGFNHLAAKHQNVARQKIKDHEDIWPVFAKLFSADANVSPSAGAKPQAASLG